jgi:competence protein ComEC
VEDEGPEVEVIRAGKLLY